MVTPFLLLNETFPVVLLGAPLCSSPPPGSTLTTALPKVLIQRKHWSLEGVDDPVLLCDLGQVTEHPEPLFSHL